MGDTKTTLRSARAAVWCTNPGRPRATALFTSAAPAEDHHSLHLPMMTAEPAITIPGWPGSHVGATTANDLPSRRTRA